MAARLLHEMEHTQPSKRGWYTEELKKLSSSGLAAGLR